MKNKKRVLRYALAVAVLALVGWGVKVFAFPTESTPNYLTADVVKGDIEQTVLATGTLEARNQVSVGAQVSGQIKTLKVALGDHVKAGQLIAEIDPRTQQNALRDAQAELLNVKAQRQQRQATLKQATLQFKRQQTLLQADAASREDYETAEATLTATKAEIAALDAQIEQGTIAVDTAKVNLGYTQIIAPMDGTVVYLAVKEGQTVNAAQTTPTIIMLAQLDTMTIKAQISEADVVRVQPGQPVYFTILGEPDHRYEAKLRAIEPAPESISESDTSSSAKSSSSSSTATNAAIYYNGLFDVPNPEGKLRISMTAQVSIVLAEAKDTVTVPMAALGTKHKDGTYTVRLLGADGKVTPRKVKTGINDTVNVQILDGLQPGERVIIGESTPGAAAQQPQRRPRMRL
ncbi:macrolide transporter subunit MacA [Dongia soli]|uniref:Macrolide transporter subunit MacA n=1 Tax=Dongia soli TaxID=600628 RepID=A0ABU5EEN7_9PROT|nr:macrolide transporter subunit MacA [Dongia soli]MDY0884848.1 macrolide transporter subunit MacA [Dongia soli]